MPLASATAVHWVEQGLVPDGAVRHGIRRLLKSRLAEQRDGDAAEAAALTQAFIEAMRDEPIALLPEKANEQHYEVPAEFFALVLGRHRKYSCGYWGDGAGGAAIDSIERAEAAALRISCERAGLADGQRVLELGCGWGSLSLWMAEQFPASRITALSNSQAQRRHIEAEAGRRGLGNLQVITQDINAFDTAERYDRIVSIEMFEHLRNWPLAFARVARWLAPQGRFFMHVFAHRGAPYAFVERDASDWMSRHFFSGGMMPSDDLALHCQDDLRLLRRWRWDGRHYQRTAEAWLENMDIHRRELMRLLEQAYGADPSLWWTRWRLFFMSVSELFGYDRGQQWWVAHYLFERRA
ncbi:MAG: class I SAM-dependent methyltransferase [Burkholderiales bacterium]|nr:cyclopropane-fatty-acyl-phospholipid synthase family protein [Burkholderiales bacterium]MDE1929801.1 class I SAM-dependent methyltransferase [Burkholderiales bacterium]MDE2160784.1 class I SAM-dependent methyltransferase [Burkholderiales bacterium]MDE2502713.1 class I SAM-dependent methyltransferase [Burkholderiales bacterium]